MIRINRKPYLGPVDPSKTKFERHSSIVICCVDVTCALTIQPRDSFQNLCLAQYALTEGDCSATNLDLYNSVVKQVINLQQSYIVYRVFHGKLLAQILINV